MNALPTIGFLLLACIILIAFAFFIPNGSKPTGPGKKRIKRVLVRRAPPKDFLRQKRQLANQRKFKEKELEILEMKLKHKERFAEIDKFVQRNPTAATRVLQKWMREGKKSE